MDLRVPSRWWHWPAAMLAVAVAMWAASLIVVPHADEFVYAFGHKVGDTCLMVQVTGQPCPSCGMTRSFAWAARLDRVRSAIYSPAGVTLFAWISVAGLMGAVRLATRDPDRWTVPRRPLFAWVLFWAFGLYALPWLLRLGGVNPLP